MEKFIKFWHHIFMMKKQQTHTVKQTLDYGKQILKDANIETSNIDARVLLSYITGMEHHEFITSPNTIIPEKLYKEYIKLIKRRSKFEPIAQITGEREFYSLPFKVSKGTLIPRPDTETIIDAIKSEFKNSNIEYKILDMGTGSGCILLSLLHHFKNSLGIGIDINNNAIKTAKQNAKILSLHTRSKILKQNWHNKKAIKKISEHKFHIIVSNPPYITSTDMKLLDKDVKNYEPHTALYGGNDGLDEYRHLSKSIYNWNILEKNGKIFLELGKDQEEDVKKIFEAFGFKFQKYFKDLNGIIRVIEFTKD